MPEAWIVVLGLVWTSEANRLTNLPSELIKIERVEVASEADCKRAAHDWTYTNVYFQNSNSGHAFATCAGRKPKD
jgi:hypothetical protein